MRKGWILTNDAEELQDVIDDVKQLPIADILNSYGVKFKKSTGSRLLALCPFHMDNHIGSFSVNMTTNSCWCYACNQGGGVIQSVSKILQKSYSEAALQIAADRGLIDQAKFEKLCNVKYEKKTTGNDFVKIEAVDDLLQDNDDRKKLRHDVYTAFKEACGLSKKHYDVLKNKRHLSDERIRKDYFTISSNNPIEKMLTFLNGKYTLEQIASVPGFYFERCGKGENDWKLKYFCYKGIGILLRDAKGNAKAIQVRLDDVDEGPKYIFLSGEQTGSTLFKGGAKIGNVIDYLPAENSKKIAITEGRFKAEVLKDNGFNVFSVQGVNNFKGILSMIKETKLKDIYIFYDSDMVKNPQVCAACVKLIRYLTRTNANELNVRVVVWDYNNGKGIDDLIFNDKKNTVKAFIGEEFATACENTLVDAIVESGFEKDRPVNKFTKEDRDIVLSMFETLMRAKLNI